MLIIVVSPPAASTLHYRRPTMSYPGYGGGYPQQQQPQGYGQPPQSYGQPPQGYGQPPQVNNSTPLTSCTTQGSFSYPCMEGSAHVYLVCVWLCYDVVCVRRGMDNLLRGTDNLPRDTGNLLRGMDNLLRGMDNLLRGMDNPLVEDTLPRPKEHPQGVPLG